MKTQIKQRQSQQNDSTMKTISGEETPMYNQQGHCPQCGQLITPGRCLQVNILRRDVLECPNCQTRILKCRMPGCRDYARGGRVWDNDFCPDCTKKVARTAVSGGLAIALGLFLSRRQPAWPPYIQR